MMRRIYLGIACVLIGACQGDINSAKESLEASNGEQQKPAINLSVPPDGQITLTAEVLQSEEAACVMPLRISNGTDALVSVSMFGFSVTGEGNDDTGNMFPQEVPAGEYRTARIIQIGQSCSAFDTITTKDVLCKSGGEDCAVIFEDSAEMRFVTPN